MINCEFNYCIYNSDSECSLDSISISSLGVCEDCIVPTLPDELIDKHKKETLDSLT